MHSCAQLTQLSTNAAAKQANMSAYFEQSRSKPHRTGSLERSIVRPRGKPSRVFTKGLLHLFELPMLENSSMLG